MEELTYEQKDLIERIRYFASQLWWALPAGSEGSVVHTTDYKADKAKAVWKTMRCIIDSYGFELIGRVEVLLPRLDERQAKVFSAASALLREVCRLRQTVSTRTLNKTLWETSVVVTVCSLRSRADNMLQDLS